MGTESQHPGIQAAGRESAQALGQALGRAHAVGDVDAEERADLEEDRRRQRQLDDEELGGEG